jgi:hypothetical protein
MAGGTNTSVWLGGDLAERAKQTGESLGALVERGIQAFWKDGGYPPTEVESVTRKFLRDIALAAERDRENGRQPRRPPRRKPGSLLPWASTGTAKRLAAEPRGDAPEGEAPEGEAPAPP